MHSDRSATRREFLIRSAVGLGGAGVLSVGAARAWAADAKKPLKVGAVITEFTPRSHAHVILENFLQPYLFNGQVTQPGMQVVSFYVDQTPAADMSRDVSKQFNVPIYPSIDKALCLGGDALAVDAVLLIGEHGKYPVNNKAQMQYPRKQFFDSMNP